MWKTVLKWIGIAISILTLSGFVYSAGHCSGVKETRLDVAVSDIDNLQSDVSTIKKDVSWIKGRMKSNETWDASKRVVAVSDRIH